MANNEQFFFQPWISVTLSVLWIQNIKRSRMSDATAIIQGYWNINSADVLFSLKSTLTFNNEKQNLSHELDHFIVAKQKFI